MEAGTLYPPDLKGESRSEVPNNADVEILSEDKPTGAKTMLVRRRAGGEIVPMSTLVRRDPDRIFSALREAFERAASAGDVAMVLTLSNACPADVRGERALPATWS